MSQPLVFLFCRLTQYRCFLSCEGQENYLQLEACFWLSISQDCWRIVSRYSRKCWSILMFYSTCSRFLSLSFLLVSFHLNKLMHRKQHPVLSEWLRGSAELLSRNLPWNHQLLSVLLLLSCWSSGKVPPQLTALHCPPKLPTPGLGPVGAAGGAPLGTTACFMCLGHQPWQRTACISLCWLCSETHAQI